MAITDVSIKEKKKVGRGVSEFAPTKIKVHDDKVDFATKIKEDETEVKLDLKRSDYVGGVENLQAGDYQDIDSIVNYVIQKNLEANRNGVKKIKLKIAGTDGSIQKVKFRTDKSFSKDQIESILLDHCDTLKVSGIAGSTNLNVTSFDVINGKSVTNEVEANDNIKRAFLGGDASRNYYAHNGMEVEEVTPFWNTKFGVFTRSVGTMVKNNAVKLGVLGTGAAVLATKGTAIGATMLGLVTNPATWAAVGTFAAGALPVVAAGAALIGITKWIGKEYNKARASVSA